MHKRHTFLLLIPICHDHSAYAENSRIAKEEHMQLDIESLRVLLAVLDHGGMTKAAQRLNMGQSAVSRKIQRLEDRVGRPLLIRDGHALRPTRDGRTLLNDARAMVDLHDRAVDRLSSSDLTGTVKLSSNGEVDSCQIASLLGVFKCRHPSANVEFTMDHTGSLVDSVDSGAIDLAIFQSTEEEMRPTDIKLWSEDLIWVTSASTASHDEPLPLIDFGTHCYYNEFTHRILEGGGISFRPAFSAASSLDVRAAVQSGIGVAVMSARYLGEDIVEWEPPVELDPLPRVTQVIRSVPGERPDAVAALIDIIQSELTHGRSPG
jgi:DNA-binding transcriptional LysR family regulator